MKTLQIILLLTLVSNCKAGEESWPDPPKGKLSFRNLGDKHAKNLNTETIEISRASSRIAQVTKVDRDADGKFEEFVFSASVSGQRVFVLSRLGGTNESTQFISRDDTQVMNDVRFPDGNLIALIIVSKKHSCYEIFIRHSDGYYWPADDESRGAVDSYFRTSAESLSPHLKKLKK